MTESEESRIMAVKLVLEVVRDTAMTVDEVVEKAEIVYEFLSKENDK